MKPDFSTPGTLILAAWVAEERASVVGSLLDWCGDVHADVVQRSGPPWAAMQAALADAMLAGPKLHLVILCNDAPFVAAVRGRTPPAPRRMERVWDVFSKAEQASSGKRGEWLHVPAGGEDDPAIRAQWECLRLLGMWPRSWRAIVADDLPKARELWAQ